MRAAVPCAFCGETHKHRRNFRKSDLLRINPHLGRFPFVEGLSGRCILQVCAGCREKYRLQYRS